MKVKECTLADDITILAKKNLETFQEARNKGNLKIEAVTKRKIRYCKSEWRKAEKNTRI